MLANRFIMYYKDLENKELSLMTKRELEKWVETLYKKAKQVQHSEMRHKTDSVFWKRELSKKVSKDEMKALCDLADNNRSDS